MVNVPPRIGHSETDYLDGQSMESNNLMYYVYILSNINNKVLYVGVTNDLIRRVFQHKQKIVEGFTKRYNVNKLVYYEETTDVNSALNREKQLKSFTRAKKENLINRFNPEWRDLYDSILDS